MAPAPGPLTGLHNTARRVGGWGHASGYGPRIVQSVLTSAILFFAKEKLFLYTVALLQLRKPVATALAPAAACARFR